MTTAAEGEGKLSKYLTSAFEVKGGFFSPSSSLHKEGEGEYYYYFYDDARASKDDSLISIRGLFHLTQ